jgi:ketol-acid reductoisomerase
VDVIQTTFSFGVWADLFCLSVVLVGLVCVMLIYERCTLPFRSL